MDIFWNGLLTFLGLKATAGENIRTAATTLRSLPSADVTSNWFLDTYASGPGPYALAIALIVSTIVLIKSGATKSPLRAIMATTIYAETFAVYFINIYVHQLAEQTLGEARVNMANDILSDTQVDGFDKIVTQLDPATQFTKWPNIIATIGMTATVLLLVPLTTAVVMLLIVAWPLRHLEGGGHKPFTSLLAWDWTAHVVPFFMLAVLWITNVTINKPGVSAPAANIGACAALIVAAGSLFIIKKWATPNKLIANISRRLQVSGTVTANSNASVKVTRNSSGGPRRTFADRSATAKTREAGVKWAMGDKLNLLKVASGYVSGGGTMLAAAAMMARSQSSKPSTPPPQQPAVQAASQAASTPTVSSAQPGSPPAAPATQPVRASTASSLKDLATPPNPITYLGKRR